MNRHWFFRVALGTALCLGLAVQIKPSTPAPALAASPCPTGYVQDGAVKTNAQGGLEYTCKPAPVRRIQCGPGTEYFSGAGCSFGCREKLVIR